MADPRPRLCPAAGDNLSERLATAADIRPGRDVAERLRLCVLTGRQFRSKLGIPGWKVDKKADEPHSGSYANATEDLKHFMRSHGFKPYKILMPFAGKPTPFTELLTLCLVCIVVVKKLCFGHNGFTPAGEPEKEFQKRKTDMLKKGDNQSRKWAKIMAIEPDLIEPYIELAYQPAKNGKKDDMA